MERNTNSITQNGGTDRGSPQYTIPYEHPGTNEQYELNQMANSPYVMQHIPLEGFQSHFADATDRHYYSGCSAYDAGIPLHSGVNGYVQPYYQAVVPYDYYLPKNGMYHTGTETNQNGRNINNQLNGGRSVQRTKKNFLCC